MILSIGKKNNPRSLKVEVRGSKKIKPNFELRISNFGFTLVELLAAVAVIAIGMVFVLGAFSQCMSSLTTIEKTVTANYLLNKKMWETDSNISGINFTETGSEQGDFEAPYENFSWTRTTGPISSDFGNETIFMQQGLFKETLKIGWLQGKKAQDLVVTRYVKKS